MMYWSYKPLRNMAQVDVASEKNFSVHVAGKTNGAHQEIVAKLMHSGLREVDSAEESDLILVFCPVVSRVGTDISEALEGVPDNKPKILVVMHHTFNRNVAPDSRRMVDNPSVQLTVDCLFHEGKLLSCNRNDIVLLEIQKYFGISPPKPRSWFSRHWVPIAIGSATVVSVIILTVVLKKYLY
uniref:uncharacterized protein si:ch211-245h14.1 n=1 Tax=Scatophagus argus TaxID=75038 RepID=UPI001ED85039|nr:uncharacterized protein si:ch211-245h14.1 [Scatophagus argus]